MSQNKKIFDDIIRLYLNPILSLNPQIHPDGYPGAFGEAIEIINNLKDCLEEQ